MEVTREGPVVRVRAVVSAEQIGKVF
jgi:hypothetical protein